MDLTESDEEISCTPPDIADAANSVISNLLPDKSKRQYEKAYEQFKEWCEMKKAKKISENVLLAYLEEKSKKIKSATLWSTYSMLKSTLNIKENVDIRKYNKLIPFLKKKSVGYQAKKSQVLTRDQINQFMSEADDESYLMIKIILIMGISGACRRDELVKMTIDDIEDKDSVLIVKVPDTKNHIQRTFTVSNLDYIKLCRKYFNLRPKNANNRRFFVKYQNNRCINQVVGINTIGKAPCSVAKYLKLTNPEAYTGHCFRRTSATLLANAGADIVSLKRHGGWKSSTVAEGYIEDSIQNKIKISNQILDCEISDSVPSTSKKTELAIPGINIGTCNNCTFNINVLNKN